jgi:hypothetical protein
MAKKVFGENGGTIARESTEVGRVSLPLQVPNSFQSPSSKFQAPKPKLQTLKVMREARSAMIVDPKVVTAFNETHISQMLGYLNITGLEIALLLNFKEAELSCKRVVRGGPEEATKQS